MAGKTETVKDPGLTIKQAVDKYGEEKVRGWVNQMHKREDAIAVKRAATAEARGIAKGLIGNADLRKEFVAWGKMKVAKAAEAAGTAKK